VPKNIRKNYKKRRAVIKGELKEKALFSVDRDFQQCSIRLHHEGAEKGERFNRSTVLVEFEFIDGAQLVKRCCVMNGTALGLRCWRELEAAYARAREGEAENRATRELQSRSAKPLTNFTKGDES
jgi:hypothetical protein